MLLFQLSEATAAQRRVPIHLVDATDGITPETGEATGQPQISKNGGAFANTTATLTAIGNGAYYVELTATELNTVGFIVVRFKSANTAEAQVVGQVVSFDPYDAVRAGLTALPNANAEAAGGLYTRGTGAGQINQDANGRIDTRVANMASAVVTAASIAASALNGKGDWNIGKTGYTLIQAFPANFANLSISVTTGLVDITQTAADKVWSSTTRTLTAFSTALALSVWDVLETAIVTVGSIGLKVKNNLDAAVTSRQPSGAVDLNADQSGVTIGTVNALGADQSGVTIGTVNALGATAKADVNTEVLDVMNVDTITLPGQAAPPLAPTHRQAIAWLYKVFRNRKRQTATAWELMADDEITVDAKATVSDDGTTAIKQEVITGP